MVFFDYILNRIRLSSGVVDSSPNLHHLGNFINYTDLITQYPISNIGDLAYVENSQGTAWLPGSWGGTFYSEGTYLWNGSVWDSAVDEIAKAIQDLKNTDTKLKIDAADDTAGYLEDKIIPNNESFFLKTANPNKTLALNLRDNLKPWSDVVDPTINDDQTVFETGVIQRYRVGQIWINVTTKESFICKNLTTGAAVWDRVQSPNVRVLYVQETGGQFNSINDALASITDNDINNRYIIIASGIFTETLIDLSTKPYVSLRGDSINTTFIEPSGATQHIIKMGEMNEVSFLSVGGAGTGYSGVYSLDGGVFSQLHKVSIYDSDICVLIENTTVNTEFYLEYVDFVGVYSYGLKVVNSGAGTLFVNAENQYSFNNDALGGLISTYHIEGANALFELMASGNENDVLTGNGLTLHSGAKVNVMSNYFTNYNKAYYMPNIGASPILTIDGAKLDMNTISIDIAHITGSGSFRGTTKANPTFNIVSTATFGIQYLERLLGNKRELYYDPYAIAPVAVTTPTAAACTTVNQSSVTGLVALQYSGTADQNASMNFRVPSDYQSGGRFKISWSTSATSANTVHFAPILSLKAIGNSLITQTETLTPQTIAAGTINLRQETGFFTPTTAFIKGQLGVLRLTRLATNAGDTFTGEIFINGVVFEYESNK